jgi:ABC-2 type transport system permease protein
LAAVIGALLFQVLVLAGWANFQRSGAAQAAPVLRRSMPKWLQSAFGIEGAGVGELSTFLTVAAQHPFLLLIVMALPMAIITDLIAGDQERRTMALLLARPVGRRTLVSVAFGVTLLRILSVVGASILGIWLGQGVLPEGSRFSWNAIWQVHLNLFVLGAATAGLCLLPSIFAPTRGAALGICTGIGVLSYAVHFVVQVFPPISPVGWLSVFRYYNPGPVFLLGQTAWTNIALLTAVTVVSFGLGQVLFRRRDLAL